MERITTIWLVILACLLIITKSAAQDNNFTITGTVTGNDTGESLPGVTVIYQGTSIGTSTDVEGKYALNVPDEQGTLMFTYVGYETMEVPIQGRSNIDASLEISLTSLEEIVVVGYGTQQEKDLTGSIVSVSSQEIENQPVSSVDALLQGRAAGVQISQSTGAPGGRVNIRIRGASSINAGNEPLFVIDGVPVYNSNKDPGGTSYGTFTPTNALNSINPNQMSA